VVDRVYYVTFPASDSYITRHDNLYPGCWNTQVSDRTSSTVHVLTKSFLCVFHRIDKPRKVDVTQ